MDADALRSWLGVEAATGRPFSEAATSEVIKPAGMLDSAFDALDQDPPRLATGYLRADGPFETWRTNIYSVTATGMPDGGLITTAPDLARFIDALLGGRLLSPPLVAAMSTPQGPESSELEQYGYGLELVVQDGSVTILGHGGSDPGVSTTVSHYLDTPATIVVLSNHDRGSWAVSTRLAAEFGLPEPRPSSKPSPDEVP